MEQVEEKWREDYNELLTTVSRLQDDNRKLTESLQAAEKDKIVETSGTFLVLFVMIIFIFTIINFFS